MPRKTCSCSHRKLVPSWWLLPMCCGGDWDDCVATSPCNHREHWTILPSVLSSSPPTQTSLRRAHQMPPQHHPDRHPGGSRCVPRCHCPPHSSSAGSCSGSPQTKVLS
uniref:Putative secreted peptide n=1 Tax=Anopheles braziliensis TaxID=58242 RepID=A0A2M3ZPK8_9DIPT